MAGSEGLRHFLSRVNGAVLGGNYRYLLSWEEAVLIGEGFCVCLSLNLLVMEVKMKGVRRGERKKKRGGGSKEKRLKLELKNPDLKFSIIFNI